MSVYKVEEPDEEPIFYNNDGDEVYYRLYSNHQKKRFIRVLNQMNDTWLLTYNTLRFMRNSVSLEESNYFMDNIYKIFFMEYRYKINQSIDPYSKPIKNKKNKKLNKLRKSIKSL